MNFIGYRKKIFFAFISLCYPILLFIKFYSPLDSISDLASPLMILLGILGLFASFDNLKSKFNQDYIVLLLFLFITGITSIYNPNLTFQKYILFISYIGIGYAISKLEVRPVFAFLPLLIVCAGILRSIYENVQLELIFSVSQNFISIIVLVCLAVYIFNQRNIHSSISLPILLMPIPLVFFAAGRSGIIAFMILLLLKISTIKKYLIIIIPLIIYFSANNIIQNLLEYLFSRFYLMSGENEPRFGVLLDYAERLCNSFYDLLVGVDLRELNAVNELEGNPHNSLISLHSYFGLMPFLLVTYFTFSAFSKLFLNKEFPLLLLLISILVRASTDIAMFYGPLDPIFYAIYFTVINKNNFSK